MFALSSILELVRVYCPAGFCKLQRWGLVANLARSNLLTTFYSRTWKHGTGLGNYGPFLFGDVVLMHKDIVSVGVETSVEHERCVHK
jgi:hypothetical protein